MTRAINGTAPLFNVVSVVRSAEFYREVLGFTIPGFWGEPPEFCMPERDGFVIMLAEARTSLRKTSSSERDGIQTVSK